jgi:hypothetical protein
MDYQEIILNSFHGELCAWFINTYDPERDRMQCYAHVGQHSEGSMGALLEGVRCSGEQASGATELIREVASIYVDEGPIHAYHSHNHWRKGRGAPASWAKHGAVMGRHPVQKFSPEGLRLRDLKSYRICNGAYDMGGAYWGHGDPVFAVFDPQGGYAYLRAHSSTHAKKIVLDTL